tara:strand:- start:1775 stop:2059 length:285 start_codon:yes stop_codon:yes gene_type:complete
MLFNFTTPCAFELGFPVPHATSGIIGFVCLGIRISCLFSREIKYGGNVTPQSKQLLLQDVMPETRSYIPQLNTVSQGRFLDMSIIGNSGRVQVR